MFCIYMFDFFFKNVTSGQNRTGGSSRKKAVILNFYQKMATKEQPM